MRNPAPKDNAELEALEQREWRESLDYVIQQGDRGRVQRMILREGGVLLVIGLALGVVGAFVASGAMRGLLFGVAPHDPTTFTGVALLMAVIGIGACWIPALRAARIDPAITMRSA